MVIIANYKFNQKRPSPLEHRKCNIHNQLYKASRTIFHLTEFLCESILIFKKYKRTSLFSLTLYIHLS
jgi:hypothetical protein